MSLPVNPTTGQAPPVPGGAGRMKTPAEGEPVDLGFAFLLAALIGPPNPPGAFPTAPDPGAGAALSGVPAPVPAAGGDATAGWPGALAQGVPLPAAAAPAVPNPPSDQAGPAAPPAEGEFPQDGPPEAAFPSPAQPEPAAQAAEEVAALPDQAVFDPAVFQAVPEGPPEAGGAEVPPPLPDAPQLGAAPDAAQPAAAPGVPQGEVRLQPDRGDPVAGGRPDGADDSPDQAPVRHEPAAHGPAPAAPEPEGSEPVTARERPLPQALENLRAERHEPARLMEAIARSVRSTPEGEHTVTLRLHPEHLGEVRLELRLSGRSVTAIMEVSTPEARQALEAGSDVLRQNLEGAGFTLSGFEVATGQQQQSAWDRWQALETELTRRTLLGVRPAGTTTAPGAGTAQRVRGADRHTGRLDLKA